MNEYTGITKNNGTYKVQIARKGRVFYLGNYPTEVAAAMAYDRGILLSAPWSNRRHVLNFQDTPKPNDESKFTNFEKQMLTYLRTYFPEAERNARNQHLVDMETPDVLLRDFTELKTRSTAFAEMLSETLAASERTICHMAAKLADLKERHEHQVMINAEQQVTINKLRGIREEDGRPKFKFTKITPEKIATDQAARAATDSEKRTAPTAPETPASPAVTPFPEVRVVAPNPAAQGQEVESSGVTAPGIELGSVEDQGLDPRDDDSEPIYPVAPIQPNSLDELDVQEGFKRE